MDILLAPQQLQLRDLAEIDVGELFYSPEGAGRHGGLCLKLATAPNRQGYVDYVELEGGKIPFHFRSESDRMRHQVLPLGIKNWRLKLLESDSAAYDPYAVGGVLVAADGAKLVTGQPGIGSEILHRFVSLSDFTHVQNLADGPLLVFPRWELVVEEPAREVSLFRKL